MVAVAGDASGVSVIGLAAQVNITGAEAANDRLTINALGGDDVVDASGLSAGAIALTADGGDGDDVLIGGDGNDTLIGGAGRRRPDRRPGPGHPRRRARQQHPDPGLSRDRAGSAPIPMFPESRNEGLLGILRVLARPQDPRRPINLSPTSSSRAVLTPAS